jgi:hypothetical protein
VPVAYITSSYSDLAERTEYEAYLLEAVYEIADRPIARSPGDRLIYLAGTSTPKTHVNISLESVFGDWRPKFLDIGAPLVLVTSFKLLDMLAEWVLTHNGKPATYRFAQKTAALDGMVIFPPFIESRPWMRERLVALYKELDPLRGTIIHNRHFQSSGGNLTVSSSRGGTLGPPITLTEVELRALAVIVVSIIRYLEGAWNIDDLKEKQIRWFMDRLSHLHQMPLLGQQQPYHLTVEVQMAEQQCFDIDLDKIRGDISTMRPGCDISFDLLIVSISTATSAEAYSIDRERIHAAGARFYAAKSDLAANSVSAPQDLDVGAAARSLGLV